MATGTVEEAIPLHVEMGDDGSEWEEWDEDEIELDAEDVPEALERFYECVTHETRALCEEERREIALSRRDRHRHETQCFLVIRQALWKEGLYLKDWCVAAGEDYRSIAQRLERFVAQEEQRRQPDTQVSIEEAAKALNETPPVTLAGLQFLLQTVLAVMQQLAEKKGQPKKPPKKKAQDSYSEKRRRLERNAAPLTHWLERAHELAPVPYDEIEDWIRLQREIRDQGADEIDWANAQISWTSTSLDQGVEFLRHLQTAWEEAQRDDND